METCTKCGSQVRYEDGAWVDNSEGDVCDDNDLHAVHPDAQADREAFEALPRV